MGLQKIKYSIVELNWHSLDINNQNTDSKNTIDSKIEYLKTRLNEFGFDQFDIQILRLLVKTLLLININEIICV